MSLIENIMTGAQRAEDYYKEMESKTPPPWPESGRATRERVRSEYQTALASGMAESGTRITVAVWEDEGSFDICFEGHYVPFCVSVMLYQDDPVEIYGVYDVATLLNGGYVDSV